MGNTLLQSWNSVSEVTFWLGKWLERPIIPGQKTLPLIECWVHTIFIGGSTLGCLLAGPGMAVLLCFFMIREIVIIAQL